MRRATLRAVLIAILFSLIFRTAYSQGLPLRGHDGWVGALGFSPDGTILATGSSDRSIRLWNAGKAMEIAVLKGHQNAISALSFAADGSTLASAGFDGQALLWKVSDGTVISKFSREREIFTSLAFSSDGRELAVASVTGSVHLLDAKTLQPIDELKQHKSWVNAVCFSTDGKLATGSSDNIVRLWHRQEKGYSWIVSFEVPDGEVRSLAFSKDGTRLAAGVRYGGIYIFNPGPGSVVTKWKGHVSDVWTVSFSPDGRTLATGNGDWDKPGEVKLWDTRTWKEKTALPHTGEVLSLAYSPDGAWLAVGGWDKSARLWYLEDPKQQTKASVEFHLAQTVSNEPFTGRVFVMLSKSAPLGLPGRPYWFKPQPFFAKDVKDWRPGTKLVLDDDMLGCPTPLGKLPKATYYAQAVVDFDKSNQHVIAAEGNAYSKPVRFEFDPAQPTKIELTADQVYPARQFKETVRVKLVDIESKLLTAFHGRPIRMRAGVVLPKSFDQDASKKYAVIYEIPGFGGNHQSAHFVAARNGTDVAGVEMLYVVLDPSCRLGHHVFADSDNNGPWGKALVEELIPFIEKTYRGRGEPRGRFVTGHSSGGWSSLWLQVTYADFFGGVWSTAPDPVDFRDFQRVHVYEPGVNIFTDAKGQPRPLARRGEQVLLYYKPFSDMEVVMGRSGQLFSFEAVFSPKGMDGNPRPLWDRATGAIDPATAKTWERYDIRLVLERNWDALAPKLRGKIHVYMGSQDTFYLEGATILLKESLAKLGSDAVVEIFLGRDHGTLLDRALRERIAREMAEQAKKESR